MSHKKTFPTLPSGALPPGVRGYLYFTAAITGAAIMVVEILGAKMLSPFVGTSHFVWTAQIAVTLVALACGYYAGGRLADRKPRPTVLFIAIIAAALYLALTIRVAEPVAYWALKFSLPLGSLLASTLLFFVPLALLAMTGPFLVRVMTSSLAGLGGSVGRLTAIGTLGSFVGTILIGYVMIPLLSNPVAMFITVVALLVVCSGSFLFSRQKGAMVVPLLLGLVAGLALLPQLVGTPRYTWVKEQYRGNSHFGTLQVLDRLDGSCRYYLNDNLIQNTYDPREKLSASAFTYLLSDLARCYTTNITDVLCIGMGVGIVPRDFAREGAKVDVVEINPAIVPVAVKYFDFDPSVLRLFIDDGRHFLNECRTQYDAVILDAFLGDSSPSHLMTKEAFAAIRKVLRPGGVLVINSFAEFEG
ncbi:MAG TPA: fused MFS/spermidine synthase, partial [Clostridia bacterium]|nr:fused MFS/spermidine synthase [Clostridia bacterium]